MNFARKVLLGFPAAMLLASATAPVASAQAYFYLWDNGGGNNNWGTGTNWGPNPPNNFGFNNVTPSAYYQEMGLINNGNTVNVTTSQTQFNGSAADNVVGAAGVTIDGVTATGNGSKLNIASGGSLTLYITYGPSGAPPSTTPTAGTGNVNLNNFGALTIQPGGTLTAQGDVVINSGSVTVGGVAAGGTLATGNLREVGTNSTVTLVGSANVNLTNGAVLNGNTTITGPSVVFNAPSLSLANTSVFSPDITSAAVAAGTGHSVINVSGGVSLNGTLRPLFHNGVVPHLGDVWTIFDAAHVQGNFAASDATGAGAGLATGLRYAVTTTTVGSVRGVKGQLTVENFLTAEVDRASGKVSIRNTNTSAGTGVTITGFQIGSPAGALKSSSFASPFGAPWQSANLSANSIGELNPSSNTLVGLNANHPLGNIYDPVSLETTFGTTPVSDLTFSYTRSDGRTVSAPVTYVNTGLANTLVLQVDPTDGKARIVNDSTFNNIHVDGYQVSSASLSLLPTWNSLQDQTIGNWEEASPTTGFIAELNPTADTSLNAGQALATMTGLFKNGGTQDLAFQFRVPGTGPGTGVLNGVVRYVAFNAGILIGDYNNDHVVNAADYTVWRDRLGQPGNQLPNRDPNNGSVPINSDDYLSWKANFGAFQGAGAGGLNSSAVPEPPGFVLAALFAAGFIALSRRSSFAFRRPVFDVVHVSHHLRGFVS
jgi:hypothetical protein